MLTVRIETSTDASLSLPKEMTLTDFDQFCQSIESETFTISLLTASAESFFKTQYSTGLNKTVIPYLKERFDLYYRLKKLNRKQYHQILGWLKEEEIRKDKSSNKRKNQTVHRYLRKEKAEVLLKKIGRLWRGSIRGIHQGVHEIKGWMEKRRERPVKHVLPDSDLIREEAKTAKAESKEESTLEVLVNELEEGPTPVEPPRDSAPTRDQKTHDVHEFVPEIESLVGSAVDSRMNHFETRLQEKDQELARQQKAHEREIKKSRRQIKALAKAAADRNNRYERHFSSLLSTGLKWLIFIILVYVVILLVFWKTGIHAPDWFYIPEKVTFQFVRHWGFSKRIK
ncbi:hypothetical protein [Sporolactobacillus sp. KGMB 08714]|uniref:hypothetical protein n=1 Tax=Sporolactobacillus sp. KGMB 08714 TaxID=3064704 RepID=UPI002FBE6C8D